MPNRRSFLRSAAAAFVAMGCAGSRSREQTSSASGILADADELASLDKATAWLNSAPLTGAELRGKVVLVQFWTFTCINWLRTLPYTRAWASRYGDSGLVVIGVHTPEFSFERERAHVRRATEALTVSYPVAL